MVGQVLLFKRLGTGILEDNFLLSWQDCKSSNRWFCWTLFVTNWLLWVSNSEFLAWKFCLKVFFFRRLGLWIGPFWPASNKLELLETIEKPHLYLIHAHYYFILNIEHLLWDVSPTLRKAIVIKMIKIMSLVLQPVVILIRESTKKFIMRFNKWGKWLYGNTNVDCPV